MKHLLFILLATGYWQLSTCIQLQAQVQQSAIKNVIVETYYISDVSDATDTIGGYLEEGSKTYRLFVELEKGCKLKKIYGDADHALKFISTAPFFNNIDRGTSFGKDINDKKINENTVAIDTWLTIGLATKNYMGILKEKDSDGSIIGGTHNDGGSKHIQGGLLRNTDPAMGIPLTTADGLITYTSTLSQWLDNGFTDNTGTDTTIFGTINTGNKFISNNAFLQQNAGVIGPTADNKILVAQLTTKGEISFELNIEVLDTNGNSIDYVANGKNLQTNEIISPYLTYPPSCGCTDTKYLEYKSGVSCSVPDSCKSLIVYGCMDPMACNYDPKANFNIKDLCCYPGYCNDRDISLVCPDLGKDDPKITLFPNPAKDQIDIQISSGSNENWKLETGNWKLEMYDYTGRIILRENIEQSTNVDVSKFIKGLYVLRLSQNDGSSLTKMFLKN